MHSILSHIASYRSNALKRLYAAPSPRGSPVRSPLAHDQWYASPAEPQSPFDFGLILRLSLFQLQTQTRSNDRQGCRPTMRAILLQVIERHGGHAGSTFVGRALPAQLGRLYALWYRVGVRMEVSAFLTAGG